MGNELFWKFNSRFRLATRQPASSAEEIEALHAFSPIPIPEDYLNLIMEAGGFELGVGGNDYIRIWGASRCLEMNEAYGIQASIPHSLAVGDNEGGAALIILPHEAPAGLYLIGFGCLDVQEGKYIAPGLTDLLVNAVGVGVLS